jgi:hypothetical protein
MKNLKALYLIGGLVLVGGIAVLAAGQASFSSTLSLDSIKNEQITSWGLSKIGEQNGNGLISFTAKVREGATRQILSESYTLSLTNSGSAPAYIGNIVVNLQTKASGTKYDTIASTVADRAERQTVPTCMGSYSNSPAAIAINIIDAESNDIVALTSAAEINPGETKILRITTQFDSAALRLAPGQQIRKEVLTTFENAGPRGKGEASCLIDADGNGSADNSRTIASRISTTVPALVFVNQSVTFDDFISAYPDPNIVVMGSFSSFTSARGVTGPDQMNQTISASGEGREHDFVFESQAICNTANRDGGSTFVENTALLSGDNDEHISGSPAVAQIGFNCPPLPITRIHPEVGEYTTFTQGGWGAPPSGNNAGQLLASHFSSVYPRGVEIGIPGDAGYSILFTHPEIIGRPAPNYLPAGGSANALTTDLVDPTSSSAGVFGGQVLAFQLNHDFSTAGITSRRLGELILCETGTSLDGSTVSQILAVANSALGGSSLPSDYTIGDLNDLATNLNEAFDNGTVVTDWASRYMCLPPTDAAPAR